jgi:hypothetical protein
LLSQSCIRRTALSGGRHHLALRPYWPPARPDDIAASPDGPCPQAVTSAAAPPTVDGLPGEASRGPQESIRWRLPESSLRRVSKPLVNKISFARLGKLRSYKFHELTQAYAWIIINMAFLNCILRAVMKVLGISRYSLPVCIRKIVMAVHGAIDVPSLPMIRKSPRDL